MFFPFDPKNYTDISANQCKVRTSQNLNKKKNSKPKVIDQSEFLELSKGKIYRYSSKEFIIKSTKDRFSLS